MIQIISLENICTICNREFIHKKSLFRAYYSELSEVHLTTCHPKCKKASNKCHKLKQQLLQAEYELYTLGN